MMPLILYLLFIVGFPTYLLFNNKNQTNGTQKNSSCDSTRKQGRHPFITDAPNKKIKVKNTKIKIKNG